MTAMASTGMQRAAGSAAASGIGSRQICAFSAPSRVGAGTCDLLAPSRRLSATSPLLRKSRQAATPRHFRGVARAAADVEQLKGAKEAVKDVIQSKAANPILIRLGWHDSGTYDKSIESWPEAGGATASIRFKDEMSHEANAGLENALSLLEPIKEKYPGVSYSDLFQMASATAVELAGGPKVDMKYGRVDADSPKNSVKDKMLPEASPPSPADHLRKVFNRMGFNDQEIVALSGCHTLGRSRPNRSGYGKESTKYTKDGPGNPGGSSWTIEWLKFDNSYFKEIKAQTDSELLVLPTDAVLFQDPEFKKYAEKYAEDQDAFFADYAKAHKKLSELGTKFDPPQGVTLG